MSQPSAAPRAWQVVRYGKPSEALELTTIAPLSPGPREVRVRVSTSVLNYNEVDGCRGRYLTINPPIPYTLGMEFVGEVIAAGEGAEDWMGKRVMGTATGGFGAHAEEVVGGIDMAFDVPEELSDVDAAAFYYPFHLSYLGLHERGGLKAGETVLIHAAAGGVGSAAVQLAKAAGARVIATAGSPAKLDYVRGLGADVAIDYRNGFADAVFAATDGRGVDVCFDGVGGDVMMESLRCLTRGGRHLIIGFASGIEAEEIPMVNGRALCFGNFSLVGVILSYGEAPPPGSGYNPTPYPIAKGIHEHLVELLRAGKIRTLVSETVPFQELPQALDRMEERATVGRIVVQIGRA
ncbi:MAG TPA: NADPH:quinone oxidoreductase family protein [Frankiaceae bacterium]|nr:NADPH:quinone oxidoreductase family protein [Frankiaceae bacterium]